MRSVRKLDSNLNQVKEKLWPRNKEVHGKASRCTHPVSVQIKAEMLTAGVHTDITRVGIWRYGAQNSARRHFSAPEQPNAAPQLP